MRGFAVIHPPPAKALLHDGLVDKRAWPFSFSLGNEGNAPLTAPSYGRLWWGPWPRQAFVATFPPLTGRTGCDGQVM